MVARLGETRLRARAQALPGHACLEAPASLNSARAQALPGHACLEAPASLKRTR